MMRPARAHSTRLHGQAARRYPSDLTDAQWQVIAGHLPRYVPGGRGRPRIWPAPRIVKPILYRDRTGCAWRDLPCDFRPGRPVYEILCRLPRRWHPLARLHGQLRAQVRTAAGRHTVRDYEHLPASHEAMILPAMIALMTRRLTRPTK